MQTNSLTRQMRMLFRTARLNKAKQKYCENFYGGCDKLIRKTGDYRIPFCQNVLLTACFFFSF